MRGLAIYAVFVLAFAVAGVVVVVIGAGVSLLSPVLAWAWMREDGI